MRVFVVCLEIPNVFQNHFGFVVDEFFMHENAIKSLGFRCKKYLSSDWFWLGISKQTLEAFKNVLLSLSVEIRLKFPTAVYRCI